MLSAEELLAGAGLTYEVEIPEAALSGASEDAEEGGNGSPRTVRLRPLSVHDLQLVSRAAKEKDHLMATLMVQRALVEPELTVAQVSTLPVGLAQVLLDRVNDISGITVNGEAMDGVAEAPLVKAAFVLSRELGWTPEQVNELTLGQVLLHLRMLREEVGA